MGPPCGSHVNFAQAVLGVLTAIAGKPRPASHSDPSHSGNLLPNGLSAVFPPGTVAALGTTEHASREACLWACLWPCARKGKDRSCCTGQPKEAHSGDPPGLQSCQAAGAKPAAGGGNACAKASP